ncbi:hypothetical protein LQQ78_25710 (plasmid) [Escherichia coli]|nr:hypothetical protein [Escherichia coli]
MKSLFWFYVLPFLLRFMPRKIAFLLLTHQRSLHVKIIPMLHQKNHAKNCSFRPAAFASENAKFYSAFCRGYVKEEDKEKCDDAGKLVRYFHSLNP